MELGKSVLYLPVLTSYICCFMVKRYGKTLFNARVKMATWAVLLVSILCDSNETQLMLFIQFSALKMFSLKECN